MQFCCTLFHLSFLWFLYIIYRCADCGRYTVRNLAKVLCHR